MVFTAFPHCKTTQEPNMHQEMMSATRRSRHDTTPSAVVQRTRVLVLVPAGVANAATADEVDGNPLSPNACHARIWS